MVEVGKAIDGAEREENEGYKTKGIRVDGEKCKEVTEDEETKIVAEETVAKEKGDTGGEGTEGEEELKCIPIQISNIYRYIGISFYYLFIVIG